MNKSNPLGLLVNYGDSDEEVEDTLPGTYMQHAAPVALPSNYAGHPVSAAIHPPPISHCPWSACYDENSGFTYYWNQQTNAVTWEAPPEYLLALKLAQQHLTTSRNTEVSAEEWQLYQQALVEKQNSNKIHKVLSKPNKTNEKVAKEKKNRKKRPNSESDDDYKIELITSYHNSDSESNDEHEKETPKKSILPTKPIIAVPDKHIPKKQKTKHIEFGPSLPENQSYSAPIGPELPSGVISEKPDLLKVQVKDGTKDQVAKTISKIDDEDSQEEGALLKKLKDKAKLLEKLGGELPIELKDIIKEDSTESPRSTKELDIDELLQEIESKELPKKVKIDTFDKNSASNSPKPIEDLKENGVALFPSAANISKEPTAVPIECEEKKENIYLSNTTEQRKKLRISNSVLLKPQKIETPAYTTKYSQFIEGFSSERTGLGFSDDSEVSESCKNGSKEAINYGNGLLFTRGEVLNEKDDILDDLADLVEAKLKYLSQVQPSSLTPLQEMMVQMQTLVSAFRCGALTATYWRRWVESAAKALTSHEHVAAPPGWLCTFQRSEGRYSYKREADGFVQWEYPAVASTDMDISTTPPPSDTPMEEPSTPPMLTPPRVSTPPPPCWDDPPPPGTDAPKLPPTEAKKEIGDELLSFYNDLAEIEKHSNPSSATNSPERREKSEKEVNKKERKEDSWYERSEREKSLKTPKEERRKKAKVKISSSIGMKQKTVSSLVAKWQQVAEEINSD